MIHHYCNQTYNHDCGDEDFSAADKKQSLRRVDEMAKGGLVPVSFAYKSLTLKDLEYHMESKNVETQEFKDELLTDLNYLCTFGMENPLRVGVAEDVCLIKYGKKKEEEDEKREGGETSSPSAPQTSSSGQSGQKKRR